MSSPASLPWEKKKHMHLAVVFSFQITEAGRKTCIYGGRLVLINSIFEQCFFVYDVFI
jgi:hypothetical protein